MALRQIEKRAALVRQKIKSSSWEQSALIHKEHDILRDHLQDRRFNQRDEYRNSNPEQLDRRREERTRLELRLEDGLNALLLSDDYLESSPQQRNRRRDRLFADEEPNRDQDPRTAKKTETELARERELEQKNWNRALELALTTPAENLPSPLPAAEPVKRPLTTASYTAAKALLDQPESPDRLQTLLDTLPAARKQTFLANLIRRKANATVPAQMIIDDFGSQSAWHAIVTAASSLSAAGLTPTPPAAQADGHQQSRPPAQQQDPGPRPEPSPAPQRHQADSHQQSRPPADPDRSKSSDRQQAPAAHHDPGHDRDRPTQQPEPQPRAAERHVQVLDTDDTVLAELPSPAAPRQPEVEQPTVEPKQSNRGRDR